MNYLYRFFIILFCATFFSLSAQEQAQEMTDEQKAWMDYMTPGQLHQMLASHAGKWETETTYWMTPDAEPQTSVGESFNKMIIGGRYLQSNPTGITWGNPYEGMSIEGYDNATREFTNIWIDNLGTGTSIAKGTFDEETMTINYSGEMVDPMTKEKIKYREIISFGDENSHVLNMYFEFEGKEFKGMEIIFTKVEE
jgi:hypothetical protein